MVCYLLAVTWLGILGLSSGLLEPIPFPADIQECYDYRSYNVTPSSDTAMYIQHMCYRNYQYEQMAAGNIWTGKNLTEEGLNYMNSLMRRILREAEEAEKRNKNGGRHRRQTTPRFRQEVRSPGGFQAFANCIQRLQNETVEPASAGRNTYQTFAAFHSGTATLSRAHNGPAFLPWHRIYLLLLETECNAPIPYWDSGLDHDMTDPTMSILWGPQFFGNGDGDVINGPFRDVRTIMRTPIIRDFGTGNSALFTKEGLRAVLSRRRYSDISEPLSSSLFSLEGHHNGPHNWVGGYLSGLNTAPWDPVFYMHHAYVDAVWARFREQQIENGINPETDYPRRPRRGHRPNDVINFGPYFEQVTNLEAMANRFADLVTYEPFPVCDNNCNNSPHLYCDQSQRVCISRSRPAAFQAIGALSLGEPRRRSSFSVQLQRNARTMPRGPLPIGQTFGRSPFNDVRNRPSNIQTSRLAPQIRRASSQVRSRSSRGRGRREASKDSTVPGNHLQAVSTIARSFTNTFIIDGTIDLKRWAYIPVRVVNTRSHNQQGNDPTLSGALDHSNDTCRTVRSGASKVFVASNGLNYYGTYQEFAIIDDRQPVYSTTTAVGIKNPEYSDGEVLLTAHDSCGRPCRPLCLSSVGGLRKYKGCSGAFKITTSSPQMYSLTYKDALTVDLTTLNMIDSSTDDSIPQITFVCDNVSTWPWVY